MADKDLVGQASRRAWGPFVPADDRRGYGLLARGWHGNLRTTTRGQFPLAYCRP